MSVKFSFGKKILKKFFKNLLTKRKCGIIMQSYKRIWRQKFYYVCQTKLFRFYKKAGKITQKSL